MNDPEFRLRLPDAAALDAAQQAVYDDIAGGPRGRVRGPTLVWLHSPALAERAQKVGEYLRWGTDLDARLRELAILVTARHFDSDYIWFNHRTVAADAGLAEDVIRAIEHRERPDFAVDDEAEVFAFATEILTSHRVSDATLRRIVERFGERGAVDLGALIGYYHMGAISLELARPLLADGRRTCLPT
ncbi:carboxymuconolactone decarboxylase family protein [Amorphus sp. MBR-141]